MNLESRSSSSSSSSKLLQDADPADPPSDGWSLPISAEFACNILGYAVAITFFVTPILFVVSALPLTTVAADVSFAVHHFLSCFHRHRGGTLR